MDLVHHRREGREGGRKGGRKEDERLSRGADKRREQERVL